MVVPEKVMRLAEEPNVWRPGGGDRRVVADRYVLWIGAVDHPNMTVVQRLRLRPDEIASTVAEVRAVFRGRSRTVATWEVGPSSTPDGLVGLLQGHGMVDADEPLVVGMALRSAPAWDESPVEVRRVTTLDDYRASLTIAARGFGMGERDLEQQLAKAPEVWAKRDETRDAFLAYADGEPVASATLTYADGAALLDGGATLEQARGRGAYRALVAARWAAARERGYDALVTQAGPMSRPILARLGFEEVCEVRVLLDRFG